MSTPTPTSTTNTPEDVSTDWRRAAEKLWKEAARQKSQLRLLRILKRKNISLNSMESLVNTVGKQLKSGDNRKSKERFESQLKENILELTFFQTISFFDHIFIRSKLFRVLKYFQTKFLFDQMFLTKIVLMY